MTADTITVAIGTTYFGVFQKYSKIVLFDKNTTKLCFHCLYGGSKKTKYNENMILLYKPVIKLYFCCNIFIPI